MKRPNTWAQVGRREKKQEAEGLAKAFYGAGYKRMVAPGRLRVTCRPTNGGDYGVWIRYEEAASD